MLEEVDITLAFPSQYLKAADLRGKTPTLHVHDVNREQLQLGGGGKKSAIVVDLLEMQKRKADERKQWILNKTNMFRLAWHLGGNLDLWVGKPFKLSAGSASMMAKGEDGKMRRHTVPALRVVKAPDLQNEAGRAYVETVLPQQWRRWWKL